RAPLVTGDQTCALPILGFVSVNPPHLVLVLAWVVTSALLASVAFGRVAARRIGRFLLTAAPLAILFNLWWIVPAVLTITSSVFEIGRASCRERASLLGV